MHNLTRNQMLSSEAPSRTRRPRTCRNPGRKRIALTQRDFEIFGWLFRYRYLRSTYLHAFVGGASETRFKERVGDLFHEGYIDRPQQQWQLAEARCRPAVYENNRRAEGLLHEYGDRAEEPRLSLGSRPHRQFAHTLMICEVLASLEFGVLRGNDLRFVPWPEILGRAPATTRASPVPFRIPTSVGFIAPDAMFGFAYSVGNKKLYRFFALEVDRGTMPVDRFNSNQSSFLSKLTAYNEVVERRLYKTHLGLPNLLVLTVTTNDRHKIEMLKQLSRLPIDGAAFLFKSLQHTGLTSPETGLLTQPWERANFPPIVISAP